MGVVHEFGQWIQDFWLLNAAKAANFDGEARTSWVLERIAAEYEQMAKEPEGADVKSGRLVRLNLHDRRSAEYIE